MASLSNIDHVPTVTGGTATAGAASVTWRITFNAKSGDAKKLTFKYTDTIGNERQESAVVSSAGGSVTLSNSVSGQTTGASTTFAVIARNDIVMKYVQEGSTFFDKLDVTAATVHDELAADVTVGSTFTVASAEVINYYLFQEVGAVTAAVNADVCAGWANTAADLSPDVIFEFNGQMTAPIAMCTAANALSAASVYTTGIQTLTGLTTATCALVENVSPTGAVNVAFDLAFPWGANHVGTAVYLLACTLPLGVDGASFKVHAMLNQQTGWNLGVVRAATVHAGQAYQHRAQNNNGRTFTVTQAYENKVSEMTHFSRLPAANGELKTSAYGLLSAASFDDTAFAVATDGNFIPGTYYNVKLYPSTVSAAGLSAKQTTAFAKVVVGHATIISIEIVSGGLGADALKSGGAADHVYHMKCDTRIHPLMKCTAHTTTAVASKQVVVTLGIGTTHAGFHFIASSMEIGTTSTSVSDEAGFCKTGSTGVTHRRNVLGLCKAGVAVHTTNVVFDCACTAAALASCTVVAGGSGTKTAIDTAANLQAIVTCTLTGNKAAGANADSAAVFPADFVNSFAYVAGFYDTGTPKFLVDVLHEGINNAELLQGSQSLTVMGGISGTSNYYYRGQVGVNEVQMFSDLQSPGSQGGGLGRKDRALAPTASVLAGRGAHRIPAAEFIATKTDGKALAFFNEHAQKYQYAGRGFDQLTVTPTPDSMTDQKVVITYNGAAGACSVAEVDRGTHESSVCSGRGNCDHASGTCVCDLGYTLEACSEQTVLV